MVWNYADLWESVADAVPFRRAQVQGPRESTWRDFDSRADALARHFLDAGLQRQSKVAAYLFNAPEYLETYYAAFKAGLAPVNTNYRYVADELIYLFDNADAEAVVFHAGFAHTVDQIRGRLPKVRTWVAVAEHGHPVPDFAVDYEAIVGRDVGRTRAPWGRSGDDVLILYTGGTTGMPKGVMWAHNDMREITLQAARKLGPVPETLEQLVAAVKLVGAGPRLLPAPPLMHGTGLLTAMGAHLAGGCVITLQNASFDAIEMLEAIDKHQPQGLVLVGDAFGRPLLNALDADPGRYRTDSVLSIVSSGVMWSVEVKRGLLRYMPDAVLNDGFSSSEAIGMGASVMTAAGEVQTAKFMIGDRCKVIDENDQPVAPGSGVPGLVALGPPNPVGYYKDEEKTARTFRLIDGVRHSIPGDWCLVEPDGTLTLLGRGSACINTAGEKVFPEEVEEALKTHPAIEDALVVGVPDETWGQAVTAVVQLVPGSGLDEEELRRHVRLHLAGYKTPKRVLVTDVALRAPNGKADYKTATSFARDKLGLPS